jgi:hypothetical protein
MKSYTNKIKSFLAAVLPLMGVVGAGLFASCSDWNDHYGENPAVVSGNAVEIYNGSVVNYMKSNSELSQLNTILESADVYSTTSADGDYTFVVSPNAVFDASKISDSNEYANYCVADMAINPAKIVDGFNIKMRQGKSIWVQNNGTELGHCPIMKVVKCSNGFIYIVNGTPEIRYSAYEYLESLGDNYSQFKKMVKSYEYRHFDRENSKQTGVNTEGRPIYDSVFIVRNTLMDRYNKDGSPIWNMRSNSYSTTMFIPTNAQIENAIMEAMSRIPTWLRRDTTAADRKKFEQWIVTACFSDENHPVSEVKQDAGDIVCVGGYKQVVDDITELVTYKSMDAAHWRPSVQRVDINNAVELSNGMAYYCQNLKIPNHVVIYRIKSVLYKLWRSMTPTQQATHYRWTNWTTPLIAENGQSSFFTGMPPMGNYPDILYHLLTAEPTANAMANNLECTVEYDGLIFNEAKDLVYECQLPAGEYYLRMGFKHSLPYSISIEFNGTTDDESKWVTLKKDMPMLPTGSNYHFDRGAASEVPHYGTNFEIGLPEGFDVDYWQQFNWKAIAYDTDGWTVGIVNIPKEGNFRLRISSFDMARIRKAEEDRRKKLNLKTLNAEYSRSSRDLYQLMMYHWCLRPTKNNY